MMAAQKRSMFSKPKARSARVEATRTVPWFCSSVRLSRSFLQVRAAAASTLCPPLTLQQNEDPVRVLTDYTEIVFASGLCKQARALGCTSDEIVECLKDIRVLGKKDLKLLLQWREQCRQHLGLETEGDDAVKVRKNVL
jgi:hypothetical protein